MPSPRPWGSGVLKIRLLEQVLQDQVFGVVCHLAGSFQPLACFLPRRLTSCHMYGLSILAVVARHPSATLLTFLALWAVITEVALLLTLVANYSPQVSVILCPPLQESSPWLVWWWVGMVCPYPI